MATTLTLADRPSRGLAGSQAETGAWIYYILFFLSGFPALTYQIVWQRAFFTLFGADIESVTLIVTVFMLGLGLGSLAGGRLSARPRIHLLVAFGAVELCTGLFGAFSLRIFHGVASLTAGASLTVTGAVAVGLLLVPTLLMGSTLPLLAEHFVRRSGNVGETVGLLYSVNTLGSGLACLAAGYFAMRILGESGSVRVAVCFNLFAGTAALLLQLRSPSRVTRSSEEVEGVRRDTIPLWIGMVLAGAIGFVALAYEIVWYRIYSFTSAGTAVTFPLLLGFHLVGVAYGSLRVRDAAVAGLQYDVRRTLAACAEVVLIGAILSFVVAPLLGRWVVHFAPVPVLPVFVGACFLGSAFPLLSHAAVDSAHDTGKSVSLLYLSNILGSTAGSFVIGFVVFDHWGTRAVSVLLLVLGFLVSMTLAMLAGPRARWMRLAAGGAACLVLTVSAKPLYADLYERLLLKDTFVPGTHFSQLMENRSGVIAVLTRPQFGGLTSTVYGGGVFDGQFNTDILRDSNGLFRPFAICGMHPSPRHVLMIGLGSGSWAQVVANLPGVQDLTIVEINPGYLPLIRQYADVRSLLTNPKVHIVIDDGRRWLIAHPERRFDFIVMNTTFNWRANATNLLSTEFLRLTRPHLRAGGILMYNTTWSERAMATGVAAYPYALRVDGFLAVSDSPFILDKERWREELVQYRIDGRPVFDLSDLRQQKALAHLLHLADELDTPHGDLESHASLAKRLRGVRLITDDNMGTEWQ